MLINKYAAVHSVACLLYQRSPAWIAHQLFSDEHPDYVAEWVERFTRGFGYAVSRMDENTFRRFVDLAEPYAQNALLYHPN